MILYDPIGNPIDYGTWTLYWKHGRQLESMVDVSYVVSFTYDANGMRKTKTAGATTFTYTYNGSQLTQMTRGTDVLDFYYDASGTPVAFKLNNTTTYYYVTTLQGDVLLILDEDGEIVVSYDYDAWGKILAIGGSMATTLGTLNPLTYRGYVYDHETGLYYLQSRYYNPEWGRFLNADALIATGQGVLGNNMFAYCGNNPVCRSDTSGYGFLDVINTIAERISGFIIAAIRYISPLSDIDKVLIATIAAEATVTVEGKPVSSEARQAMANVALNRVGSREWKKHKNVAEICQYTGFDGYGDQNYLKCMEYLNNRDFSNKTYESIIWSVMKAYSWDITEGCQLYYTPAAMRPSGAKPNWTFSLLEEVIIPGVDTWYEGKFYRYAQ